MAHNQNGNFKQFSDVSPDYENTGAEPPPYERIAGDRSSSVYADPQYDDVRYANQGEAPPQPASNAKNQDGVYTIPNSYTPPNPAVYSSLQKNYMEVLPQKKYNRGCLIKVSVVVALVVLVIICIAVPVAITGGASEAGTTEGQHAADSDENNTEPPQTAPPRGMYGQNYSRDKHVYN